MTNPYELWDSRKSIGIMRDVKPAFTYWLDLAFSGRQVNSTDEYIDFEKLPVAGRKLAPFVRPLGTGKPIYKDQSTAYRFKPAYVKLRDAVDPTRPLVKLPGIDSMLAPSQLSPMQRRDLLKAAITAQHVQAIQRRWEWLASKAVIDAQVTISGEEYPAVSLDFLREAGKTVTLGVGERWGDAGVSILDDIQEWADTMFDAQFGSFPTRLTMGSSVWAVVRKDPEVLQHMDIQVKGGAAVVTRGVIGGDKVIKVGELSIGGASGAVIELWLNRDTYIDDTGMEVPFLGAKEVVLTGSSDSIMGYRCFGAIIDPYAQYQSLDIFPRNWFEPGDPAVEMILHQSAPLMVPVNPNATFKATVLA